MIPFRVFDRENKITWLVLNFHPGPEGGSYLVAREDDSDLDGEICTLPVSKLTGFRMVGFAEDPE